MIKILFVCHGNICRSPMAEFICKKMVEDRGMADRFLIESAATSREEIGNGVYPPARRKLASVGISCEGKRARQVTKDDYQKFDYIIVMEQYNLRNLQRILPSDPEKKIYKLLDFDGSGKDIDDPWYTGDFDTTYEEIFHGLTAFFEWLKAHDSKWDDR